MKPSFRSIRGHARGGLIALGIAALAACSGVTDEETPPGPGAPEPTATAPSGAATAVAPDLVAPNAAGPTATATPATPGGPAVTTTRGEVVLGPAGGVLRQADGSELIVPDGALAESTTLTLEVIEPPTEAALGAVPVGRAYAAGPEGTQFLRPVEIRMPYEAAKLPPGATSSNLIVRMAPHGSTSYVSLAATVDLATGMLVTRTTHFTDFVPSADPNPVFITTASLATATSGVSYDAPLAASGGAQPYQWSPSGGSVLPPGLAVLSAGRLKGTPSQDGNYAFFLTVGDAEGRAVQSAFAMTVNPALNPVPVIAAVTPDRASTRLGALTVQVAGTGFVPSSKVYFDTTVLPTTYVSATSLAASLAPTQLGVAGAHAITVRSPTPGGGKSGVMTFTAVAPPAPPVITTVTPSPLPVTNVDTQVTITGTGFTPTTVAALGTRGLATAYQSSTSLLATIPGADLGTPGVRVLDLYVPEDGGAYSATFLLSVGAATDAPALTAVGPRWVYEGSGDSTITLTGTGFVAGGRAYFGPHVLSATVVDATAARVVVPGSLSAHQGFFDVRWVNPGSGGGSSSVSFGVGPAPIAWRSIVTTHLATCLFAFDDSVYCAGSNAYSLLGDGVIGGEYLWPTRVAGGMKFDSFVGDSTVCGLRDGDAYCWGLNDYGQAGQPKATPRVYTTTRVPLAAKLKQVSPGRSQSCGITTTNQLLCWGGATYGDAGAASNAIAGNYTQVSSEQDLVCALDLAGEAHCWGKNALPTWNLAGRSFASIHAHFQVACGLQANGELYCWGGSESCFMATPTLSATTPERVPFPAGVAIADVSTGCFSSCALGTDGKAYCWGRNPSGELGIGTKDQALHTPAVVPGVPPLRQLSNAGGVTCGLTTTNQRFCWGNNSYGLYGDGTKLASMVPLQVF